MNGSLRRFNRDRTGCHGKTRFLRPTAMVVVWCLTAATAAVAAVPTVASAAGAPALFAGRAAGGGRYVAEIRRTEYGIPHILARDYAGLGYGYGYAFAQDNLCTMADRVVTLRGERSGYFGPTGDSGDTLGASTTNLNSDIYYQGLRKSGAVGGCWPVPLPWGQRQQARQLVDGYVAGYNRYLRDSGVAYLPDPTCRGQSWVTPITAIDVWTLVYDLDTLTGIAAFKDGIATARPQPPGAGCPEVPLANAGQRIQQRLGLGRDATADHGGMVLANPHVPG